MLDPRLFTPLPASERARMASDFVAFALERDGEPDVERRLLARRERFFRDFETRRKPAWTGEPIEQKDFDDFFHAVRPIREASPLLAWLVHVARANEGEGWGVEYLLDRGGFDGLGRGGGALAPRDFADLEETYHTRILRAVVNLFGVDYELRPPPRVIQDSVRLMAHLPRAASYMLLLAGELMGTVAFAHMQATGERLLSQDDDMRACIRELLDEIMVDEIGHVTFLLGSMQGWQLGVVRGLARAYLAASNLGYYRDSPAEARAIRDGLENYSLGLFAERVVRRAFVPAAYWPAAYPRPTGARA
jgi:hypothetical protein